MSEFLVSKDQALELRRKGYPQGESYNAWVQTFGKWSLRSAENKPSFISSSCGFDRVDAPPVADAVIWRLKNPDPEIPTYTSGTGSTGPR